MRDWERSRFERGAAPVSARSGLAHRGARKSETVKAAGCALQKPAILATLVEYSIIFLMRIVAPQPSLLLRQSIVIGACGHLERQAVERRLHVRRQVPAQELVIEIGMQVGQDRSARLDTLDPGQRLVDTEVARVRPIAQRIDDPQLEASQR
jgi:hypothetical protein